MRPGFKKRLLAMFLLPGRKTVSFGLGAERATGGFAVRLGNRLDADVSPLCLTAVVDQSQRDASVIVQSTHAVVADSRLDANTEPDRRHTT